MNGEILRIDCKIDGVSEARIVFVAGAKLAGTVDLQYRGRRSAYISRLFVAEPHRRLGVASSLIAECCRLAKEAGCETASLTVGSYNKRAAMLYRKLGFVFAYNYDDGDDLMTMPLAGWEAK